MRKFKALINEFGLDDGGVASFVFKVQSLKKGEIYEEHVPHGGIPSGYVIDDNSCWNKIGTENFKTKFKEVTDELENK